jgi:plastocyanin
MNFSPRKALIFVAGAVLLVFGCPISSLAATATVQVGSNGLVFTPATTNIAVNDQVIWIWGGPATRPHSTTSGTVVITPTSTNDIPDGLWDSGVVAGAHSFTNTFSSAGSFPYYCQVHYNVGMTGAVLVAAASLPPSVAITNPADGTVFSEPANVTIQATATDSNGGGSVTNVQFLADSTVLTNETVAPFSVTTNNLTAGSYTFSAVATDNAGLTATNAVTINVVTPVPLALDTPTQLSSTSFQFNYSANVGLSYVIQQSTNLASTNWIAIFTNTATSNPVTFVDSNAIANPGFYRVIRLPNP